MLTRIKAALGFGRGTSRSGAPGRDQRARAADSRAWRKSAGKRDAGFAAEFGKLASLADNPTASEAGEMADRWLAAFGQRRPGTLESAPAAARVLRRLARTDELVKLQEDYPEPTGHLARPVTAAGAAGIAWEVVAEPGVPAQTVAATAAGLQRLLDTYEFRGQQAGPHKEAVRHALAVARLRQNRPREVPSLCVRELARKDLTDTERASVLATLVLARQQLGQPYRDLLEQARALDPDADLVAEATAKAAAPARQRLASPLPAWLPM